jgi:peptidoglycan/xylan/chitin deacetylase (PgdA/CDA1 family)
VSILGAMKEQVARALGPVARTMTGARPRILMYHRFGPDGAYRRLGTTELDAQLRYLKTHFRPTKLSDVIARLRAGQPLDRRTVVLTVDDGYEDFATYAYPVLKRHGMPATVYVVSRFLSGECWLWFDALQWIVDAAPAGRHALVVAGTSFDMDLDSPDARRKLWGDVAALTTGLAPDAQWRNVADFARQLRVELPERPVPEYSGMTWDQLRALDPAIVEVGAHTVSHPTLAHCPRDLQEREIRGCKTDIEQRIGREAANFCYPNGLPGDFTPETEAIVAAAGYASSVMACGGLASRASPIYRLERLGAPEAIGMFRNAVNGVWHLRGTR